MQAKQLLQKSENAAALLSTAVAALQKARLYCKEELCAEVLANLGYVQFMTGDEAAAEQSTRMALTLKGKAIIDGQRKDAATHRVEPMDARYDQLLDKLSAQL